MLVRTGTRRGTRTDIRLVEAIADVVAMVDRDELHAVGIDMPIGLPRDGSRPCDVEARRRLGARRSSVFPTPARAVLSDADDYQAALRTSIAVTGKGLSKQAFHLLPKIAELDAAVTTDHQRHLFECHPESCFVSLAGRPLDTTKRTAVGLDERTELLRPHFPTIDDLLATRLVGARPDDILDALAVAWAARRWHRGTATVLGDGSTDDRGLRMEIVV